MDERQDQTEDETEGESGAPAMPDLPPSLTITGAKQYKALGDPLRVRILELIQHQPRTAKQLAGLLERPPGTIGYQLRVLEEAGLAQVVARRLVKGIVAKYYARTAHIFLVETPQELGAEQSAGGQRLQRAHDELAESLATLGEEALFGYEGNPEFFHVRLSPEHGRIYRDRLSALTSDLLHETPDPDGTVFAVSVAFFVAPPSMQVAAESVEPAEVADQGDEHATQRKDRQTSE
jgi:DNA-binding transcriptional ArsR family regulator